MSVNPLLYPLCVCVSNLFYEQTCMVMDNEISFYDTDPAVLDGGTYLNIFPQCISV